MVMVGSSADNEIVVNSKYVSRRQLMLVEETKRESKTEKSNDHRHFFVICLSQTNFTTVKYPKAIKLQVGLMFYLEDIKYQVLKILREVVGEADSDEDDRTLTMLPSERK